MTRVLDIARIHVVDPRTAFGVPLAGLGAALLFSLVIRFAARGSDGFSGGAAVGSMLALYVILVSVHYQSITRYFPLLTGLSATRREFYLGTTLYVLVQAVAFGLLLTSARAVEQVTGGWGIGLQVFAFGVPPEAGLLERWPIYTAALLAFASLGLMMGATFKRWGLPGLYVLTVGSVVLISGLWAIVERMGWSVSLTFAGAPVVLPVALAVVQTGIGWLLLRRSTP